MNISTYIDIQTQYTSIYNVYIFAMKSKCAPPVPFTIHLQLRHLLTAVQLPSLYIWPARSLLIKNDTNPKKQSRQKREEGFLPPPG